MGKKTRRVWVTPSLISVGSCRWVSLVEGDISAPFFSFPFNFSAATWYHVFLKNKIKRSQSQIASWFPISFLPASLCSVCLKQLSKGIEIADRILSVRKSGLSITEAPVCWRVQENNPSSFNYRLPSLDAWGAPSTPEVAIVLNLAHLINFSVWFINVVLCPGRCQTTTWYWSSGLLSFSLLLKWLCKL